MGMMARMRSLAPWFIILVGGLFVLFMVLSDSKLSNIVTAKSNNVGSINGKEISYQEYSNLVEQYRKEQAQRSGQEIPETQMDAFRDQVWESLVSQKLIEEKVKQLGLTVTDQEIADVIQGPNPPQIITQYFVDSTGKFNRQAYDRAIYDPQNKKNMVQVEEMVRQQLLQQKLTSFLDASIVISDDDIKNAYVAQNVKLSADYALVETNSIQDSSVKVTDEELEKYYKEHPDEFKIEAQRQLKYVLFSLAPTKDDSISIKNNLAAIANKIKDDTTSFKDYVKIYSDKPYSLDTLSLSLLPGEAGSLIAHATKGSLVGPVDSREGYVLYKLENIINSKDVIVKASHILIKSGKDEAAAKAKIDEIYNQLKNGANFEQLAKEKSEDGSARKSGDLGWFSKGQMVKEFENAAFNGKIGEIQKPIKTQFGYHIVKVTDKSDKKYVVEKIVNEVKASPTTLDRIYEKAGDFSYIADKNEFLSEAELMKYDVKETPPFVEESKVIPGLGANVGLIKFAFENGLNDVSKVFKVPAGYVVATISSITKAGKKSFDEEKKTIAPKVLKDLKFAKAKSIAEEIKSKLGESSDLSKATEVYSKAKVGSIPEFTANGNVPGVGRDLAFTQAALDETLNKITAPIKGVRGYFLLKVTNRTSIDSTMFSIQKNSIRDNLLAQSKSRVLADWIDALKKDADIEDNRYMFYR
jgi:peptidyl-prolyl cis-trans isomerase D